MERFQRLEKTKKKKRMAGKARIPVKARADANRATTAAKARTLARARAAVQPTAPRSSNNRELGRARNSTLTVTLMPANRFNGFKDYGIGIGLRIPHYNHILEKKPLVDWFEIISENYMVDDGRPHPT